MTEWTCNLPPSTLVEREHNFMLLENLVYVVLVVKNVLGWKQNSKHGPVYAKKSEIPNKEHETVII